MSVGATSAGSDSDTESKEGWSSWCGGPLAVDLKQNLSNIWDRFKSIESASQEWRVKRSQYRLFQIHSQSHVSVIC